MSSLRSCIHIGAALLLLLSLAACASQGQPGGSLLYGDDGELLDSEIRLETYRPGRTELPPDLRVITCDQGKILGRVDTRYKEGEGEVPIESYGRLWRTLVDGGSGVMTRDAAKTDGGLYHIVRLRRGLKVDEFSAQERVNFLGVGTSTVYSRLELVNAIAKTVSDHVSTQKKVTIVEDAAPKDPAAGADD
jgi:hypothetical protein